MTREQAAALIATLTREQKEKLLELLLNMQSGQ